MTAKRINAYKISEHKYNLIRRDCRPTVDQDGNWTSARLTPQLGIQVGQNSPKDRIYAKALSEECRNVGICCQIAYVEESKFDSAREMLTRWAGNPIIDGILIPAGSCFQMLSSLIPAEKDVANVTGEGDFTNPAAQAVMDMLHSLDEDLTGRHVVIVSRDDRETFRHDLFNKLALTDCVTTVCSPWVSGLREITRMADVLIVNAETPSLITADMVKPGAIMIDACESCAQKEGQNPDGSDGDRSIESVCSWIGARSDGFVDLTHAELLQNIRAACEANKAIRAYM